MYCIYCNTEAPGLKIGKHKPRIYIKDTTNYGYERRRTQQDIAETYREVL